MVHPLRRQGDAGHEAEGLVEIGELESLGDGVAAVHLMPAGEAREGVGALAAVELLRPALVGHIRVPISAVHALRGYVPAMSNPHRSEEHTSELQSLMRISYAVFCLKKKINNKRHITKITTK